MADAKVNNQWPDDSQLCSRLLLLKLISALSIDLSKMSTNKYTVSGSTKQFT